jgi:hypothetical protein
VTHPGARGGDSRAANDPNDRGGQKAAKPRRVGSLERDQPIPRESRPCRAAERTLASPGEAHEGRQGGSLAVPVGESNPGGRKAQESYALGTGLNRRPEEADSRAEQGLEGEGGFVGFANRRSFEAFALRRISRRGTRVIQHQEGNGAGDGVRLRGRKKALEGETPGVDPA